jgi:acetyltransferase EpsM
MTNVVIIGASGLARELAMWCRDEFDVIGFSGYDEGVVGNFGVDITPDMVGTKCALMAVGAPKLKMKLYHELTSRGFIFLHFIHPSAMADKLLVVQGTVIAPRCVIGPDVCIGLCSYINFMVGIGHDVEIGDFVQVNPGVQIGGNTKIGDGTLIGSGATILEKKTIGKNSVIGSGSICTRDVEDGITVIGNPARRFL